MYVHRYYSKDLYKMCYENAISPLKGQPHLPKTSYDECLPPNNKRGPRRPKKLRKRKPSKEGPRTKLRKRRKTLVINCGICGKPGHNR